MQEKNWIPQSLKNDFNEHLAPYGVKWPSPHQEILIVCLYENIGNPVSQEEIAQYYQEKGQSYKLQGRHIASDGWYIVIGNSRAALMFYDKNLKRNEYALISTKTPNPVWFKKRLTRTGNIKKASWEEILQEFEFRGCAVCGIKAEHYDRGHLDPNQGYSLENIVPMCVRCNNYAGAHDIAYRLEEGLIARPISMKTSSPH